MGRLINLATYRAARAAASLPAPVYLGAVWSRCWVLVWECVHKQRSMEAA